ncbi:MAG: DUF4031 domain-containing protein [Chloroflexi bacterium]|nr:DUF4031 domain-containing protein [Chloroflexota bacterium]
MVYVDEQRPCMGWGPGRQYRSACHLMADSDAELEAFRKVLGLRANWRRGDHYDLTPNKRRDAVRLGAIETTVQELVKLRQRKRLAQSRRGGGRG